MNKSKEESEFGSGLVVNLVKFFEHFQNRQMVEIHNVDWWIHRNKMSTDNLNVYGITFKRSIESFQKIDLTVRPNVEKALSSKIELWANGATDHLYDLKVPKKWKRTAIGRLVRKLRNKGLKMGHGFTGINWTVKDISELRDLVEKICLKIDQKIGVIDGDWGRW